MVELDNERAKKPVRITGKNFALASLIATIVGSVGTWAFGLSDYWFNGSNTDYPHFAPEQMTVGNIPNAVQLGAFVNDKKIHVALLGCYHTSSFLSCEFEFSSLRPQDFQLSFLIGVRGSASYYVPTNIFNFRAASIAKTYNHDITVQNPNNRDNLLLLSSYSELTLTVRFAGLSKNISKLHNLKLDIKGKDLDFGKVLIDIEGQNYQ